jgi:beta-lactamase class A
MKEKMKIILALVLMFLIPTFAPAQLGKAELKQLLKKKDVTVGVAAICGNKEMTYNNKVKYPLASVMKLPVAICVLQKMEANGTSLDVTETVEKSWMNADTYSPMRDELGIKDVRLTMRQLLNYCVGQSDNNACDWLVDYCGGMSAVENCVKSLGLKHIQLRYDESGLHADIYNEFQNWSRPLDIAELLQQLDRGNILSAEHREFLLSVMTHSTTGTNKIKAGLPANTPVAHKTGHTDKLNNLLRAGQPFSLQVGDNDAAIITLPDGRRLYLVVFLKLSHLSDTENAALIAQIANIVYTNALNE